jgi:hypothetical protein
MSRERALVWLVAADVFLAFSGMGVEMFFNWTLPGPLREYVHWYGGVSLRRFVLLALWGMTAACAIAAWVGLLNYWWFARRLYVISCIAWLTLILCSGPSVDTPVSHMLHTLNALVGGVILGLIYFSDLSLRFERSTATVASGVAAKA